MITTACTDLILALSREGVTQPVLHRLLFAAAGLFLVEHEQILFHENFRSGGPGSGFSVHLPSVVERFRFRDPEAPLAAALTQPECILSSVVQKTVITVLDAFENDASWVADMEAVVVDLTGKHDGAIPWDDVRNRFLRLGTPPRRRT